MIKILDSKNGQFKIRVVEPNGQPSGTAHESYKDARTVDRWFVLQANNYFTMGRNDWDKKNKEDVATIMRTFDIRDCTSKQRWFSKFGAKPEPPKVKKLISKKR